MVLLEKLTGSQPVKKFPTFHGTRNFTTSFTSACHLSLSWARSIQSMPPIPLPEDPFEYYPPIYAWVFQVVSFPQGAPPKTCMHLFFPPYVLHASPSHSSWFITWIIFGEECRSLSSSLCSVLHSPVTSSLSGPNNLSTYCQTPSAYVPPSLWTTMFHTHTKQQAKL